MKDVFWIGSTRDEIGSRLAIVLRPRGGEWLEDELLRMKRSGVTTLVSLLELEEAACLGLAEEEPLAEQIGFNFLSYPIPDVHVPPDAVAFRRFVSGLAKRLRDGEKLGMHCRGSIGRAPLTAACTLIHLGWKAEDALAAIEAARGCAIPDTDEQRYWILNYRAAS